MFAATIVLHRYVRRRKHSFTWLAPQSIKHTFTTPAPLMYSTLTTASLNSQLNKCGYCVVRGALSTAQTDQTLALIWDYIEAASAAQQKLTATTSETVANRHEPWSWTAAWPAHVEGGILPYFGAGQVSPEEPAVPPSSNMCAPLCSHRRPFCSRMFGCSQPRLGSYARSRRSSTCFLCCIATLQTCALR